MSRAIQIIGQQVPDDFAQTLADVRRDQPERLSHLLRIANEAGWTLTALAEPLGVTCEAVRIRVKRSGEPRNLPAPAVEIPSPPARQKTKTETEQEAAAERARNRKLQPCGTRAAYERHKDHGEAPCEACRQAGNDYGRDRRAVYGRVRSRAMNALKRQHPDVFGVLFAAERERERAPLDTAARERARQRALGALTRECPQDWAPLFAAEWDREQRRAGAV